MIGPRVASVRRTRCGGKVRDAGRGWSRAAGLLRPLLHHDAVPDDDELSVDRVAHLVQLLLRIAEVNAAFQVLRARIGEPVIGIFVARGEFLRRGECVRARDLSEQRFRRFGGKVPEDRDDPRLLGRQGELLQRLVGERRAGADFCAGRC